MESRKLGEEDIEPQVIQRANECKDKERLGQGREVQLGQRIP